MQVVTILRRIAAAEAMLNLCEEPPEAGLSSLLAYAAKRGWEPQADAWEPDDTRPLTGMERLLQEARQVLGREPAP